LHNASGNVPFSWFPDRSRTWIFGKFVKDSGSDPVKSLFDKFKYSSDLSMENCSDIAPCKSLLDKSKDIILDVTP
jgi:hypothetical protein